MAKQVVNNRVVEITKADKAIVPDKNQKLDSFTDMLKKRNESGMVIPGAVFNPSGLVAIQYYQTTPRVVEVNHREYAFVVQNNVCLGWVDPLDVNTILSITGGCCGQNKSHIFFLCTELNERIWRTGDR